MANRRVAGLHDLRSGGDLANAVVLGLQTYPGIDRDQGETLNLLNDVFLGVFVVELALRIGAYWSRPLDFFRAGWNVFDFVVIGFAFVPGVRESSTLLQVARLLRVVRIVRIRPAHPRDRRRPLAAAARAGHGADRDPARGARRARAGARRRVESRASLKAG